MEYGSYFKSKCAPDLTWVRMSNNIGAKPTDGMTHIIRIPFPPEDLGDYPNEERLRELLKAYRNLVALMLRVSESYNKKVDAHVFIDKRWEGIKPKYIQRDSFYAILLNLCKQMIAQCTYRFPTNYSQYFDIWWQADIFPMDIYVYLMKCCQKHREKWEPYYAVELLKGTEPISLRSPGYRSDFPFDLIEMRYKEPN